MPSWLGGPEIIVLIVVIAIVFGWKKLPDAARSLGRSMRIFKAEVEEMKHDKQDGPPSAASRETVDGESVRRETRTETVTETYAEPARDETHHQVHHRADADPGDPTRPAGPSGSGATSAPRD
ncbi:Sec-independent protein translocase subunit TatA [Agilicoccus flavus]|uniref:Sec-independent protein translocase subunit TatA n=1 Tax=Agilicoccus flavus TaxID=2775968 RepID=UPI001CF69ED6|nr:Sec-independent protein translocase subunit TatA [Agilicoccus flavus]